MDKTITFCDRCGGEITKPMFPFVKFETSVFVTSFLGHVDYDYISERKILCNKCSKDFEKFMKG